MGIVFNAMSCEAERKVKHENKEETQNTCRGKQSWKLETKKEKVEGSSGEINSIWWPAAG